MRNYKIVRIAAIHSKSAIDLLYAADSGLANCSYADQQRFIFDRVYMYSDMFSKEMNQLGHRAEEIVFDVEPLQKAWVREQGHAWIDENWQTRVILLQLEHLKPEVVFFQDVHALGLEIRSALKHKIPSIQKIVIFRGFPGVNHKLFKELATADLLFVGSPLLVEQCRKQGLHPHLVYHYFDTSVLEKLKTYSPEKPKVDFSFIGSSGYGYKDHRDRYEMLWALLQQTQIQLWVDEPQIQRSLPQMTRAMTAHLIKMGLRKCSLDMLKRLESFVICPAKVKKLISEEIENLLLGYEKEPAAPKQKPLRQLFPNRCHSPLFGLDMYHMLQRSKVVLNRHSMPAKGTVDNIRLFQATGVGACLLTDTGANMAELFEPDREIVTYSSYEECLEKASYLIDNERVRKDIAEAGQKRTLKSHTAAIRCQQMDRLICEALN